MCWENRHSWPGSRTAAKSQPKALRILRNSPILAIQASDFPSSERSVGLPVLNAKPGLAVEALVNVAAARKAAVCFAFCKAEGI